jgi:hypothetical protein
VLVREALVHAVADGAVVVEAGKHLFHLLQHLLDARHVQKGFLLAGKRGVGQILRRGRRAHGKAGLRVARAQCVKGIADGLFQISWKRLLLHPAADFGARIGQRAHVFRVQRGQPLADALIQPAVGQKLAKGVRRGGKARGHAHALRQLRNHLAQAGVFAADGLDIAHSQFFKRHDQGGRIKKCRHGKSSKSLKNGAHGLRPGSGQTEAGAGPRRQGLKCGRQAACVGRQRRGGKRQRHRCAAVLIDWLRILGGASRFP